MFVSQGIVHRYNPQTRKPVSRIPTGRWVRIREHFAIETAQGLVLYGIMNPARKGFKSYRVFQGWGFIIVTT